MATRLFFALALLLASVQLSHAVHFTNQNWTVVQWKDFLLQWEYDDGDPPNNGWYWGVVVWSAPNKGPVQLSNDIFNIHYQPAFTSYNVTIDCGVDVGQQMYFGITLYSNNVTEGTSFSPPWSLKALDPSCVRYPDTGTEGFNKGEKIAIGISSVAFAVFLAVFLFYWRRDRRKQRLNEGVAKPASTTNPRESGVELRDRERSQPNNSDTDPPPPPYSV